MSVEEADAQLVAIGALLESRVEELAYRVVDSIRTLVDFYRDNQVVSDGELHQVATDNLQLVFRALQNQTAFDTSVSAETGRRRACAGVPLTAVMDAYRVASHHCWDAMVEFVSEHPDIAVASLLNATSKMWDAQDNYTVAMTAAYHEQATHLVVEDATEQSALAEALLEGRPLGEYSLWDVARLLRIPARGPYVVITAAPPRVGAHALPGMQVMLRGIDVDSAWRLLPDVQIGIAHIASSESFIKVVELLRRVATTKVGVSPQFNDLADTAKSTRYARVAMNSQSADDTWVSVFQDSVLGVAAVSAPDVTRKLAEITLGSFGDLQQEEKQSLLETFAVWLDHKGSVSETAAAMFCHPNTVRNRLRRIEDRTGRSLSAPLELAELCLAFEVAKTMPQ